MSYLDSNKKLVTHKGITVTKGYLEGTMEFMETVKYLSSLGIHGLFEDVVRKAVFVPPGYQAKHQISQRTYQQGDFIPVPERSWEEFLAAAQGDRNENWIITEVPVMEGIDVVQETTPVSSVDYQQAINSLATKYDENELGKIFRYLKQQAESIQDPLLRDEQLRRVHEMAQDVDAKMKLAEELAKDSQLKLSDVIDAREIINTYRVEGELRYLAHNKKLALKVGKGEMHFGALVAVLELSGNINGLHSISELMDNVRNGHASGAIELSDDALFPGGLTKNGKPNAEAVEIYKDMLDLLRFDLPENDLLLGISRVATSMRELVKKNYNVEVPAPHNVLEAVEKVSESISETLKFLDENKESSAMYKELYDAINGLKFLHDVRQTHASLTSGNLLVQSMLEFSTRTSGRVEDSVIEFLDEYFDFESSIGMTLKEKLEGRNGSPTERDLRDIKEGLYRRPLAPKRMEHNYSRTGEYLSALATKFKKAFGKDLQRGGGIKAVSTIPSEVVDDVVNNFGKKFFDYVRANKVLEKHGITKPDIFEEEFAATVIEKTQPYNPTKLAMHPKDAAEVWITATKRYAARVADDKVMVPEDSAVPNDLANPLKNSYNVFIRARLRGHIPYINKNGVPQFNASSHPETPPSEGVGFNKEAVEGLVALFMHNFVKREPVEGNIDIDADARASTAVTYFCGGANVRVSPETGGFITQSEDGSHYLNMRILQLARYLPPLGRSGYAWAPDVQRQMDREISASTGKAIEDITDIDRLEHFASVNMHPDSINNPHTPPIHVVGENIRAGLRNLVNGETNVPGLNKFDRVLTPEQTQRLTRIIDYNTDEGTQNNRIQPLHATVREYFGEKSPTEEDFSTLENISLENLSAFNGVSLSQLLNRYLDKSKPPLTKHERFAENITRLAVQRADDYLQNLDPTVKQEFLNYVKDVVSTTCNELHAKRKSKADGAQLGHIAEGVLKLTIPMSMLHEAKSIKRLEPKMIDGKKEQHTWGAVTGLQWVDKSGNTHYFGHSSGVTNGGIDVFHVKLENRHAIISGYECKMESGEPAVPHTGNGTHSARFLANFYKEHEDKLDSITINDNTLLSASWGTPTNNTFAGGYKLQRNGYKFVEAGVTFDKGKATIGRYS